MGFPGDSDGKESTSSVADLDSIPGSRRSPGEGNWQPTPVFLPEEFQGQRSLEGYSSWGFKDLDMTVPLTHTHTHTHTHTLNRKHHF